ncbi:hypothetical protein G9A89_021217 [Geosiphon pyriformis]|nr:hypothetical protein G9A89_021217 [Geosiphon pyriformis]
MTSVEDIKRELEYVKTQYGRCVEELKEKGEKLGEKEVELHDLKKNLRQRKYKDENEKNWWIEDVQELEKQKEKLEEEVKELKTSKDRWEVQMQKLQNTLMETTQTVEISLEDALSSIPPPVRYSSTGVTSKTTTKVHGNPPTSVLLWDNFLEEVNQFRFDQQPRFEETAI